MPLMTSGVYIGSDDRGYEAETSYYLNFQIISALASLAKIDSFNDSYGWENPCQYYHYYYYYLLEQLLIQIKYILPEFYYIQSD